MKTCQRCSKQFNCQPQAIGQCDCSSISLSKESRDFLKTTNYDCLCKNCLLKIEQMVKDYHSESFPKNAQEFIEGIHYYFNEEGLFVMTEVYHYLRGFCCKNGCKHCAYGYSKK